MLDYQLAALNAVREYAKEKTAEHQHLIEGICKPFDISVSTLIEKVLSCPITINFHPDRLSGSETIMEGLMKQGLYHGQFRTGTTNGGRTAHIGGERFHWEQRMFMGAYPENSLERPKYGAHNLFRYIDGASPRFGSCFFVLNDQVLDRCTFAYGDSSTNPTALCTKDTFASILAAIFEDVRKNGKLLNQVVFPTEREALAILMNPGRGLKDMGRNLDYCIEVHIHGDVSLGPDVESLYMDESFRDGPFAEQADLLCQKYEINLCWIPKRQIAVNHIGEIFRGPKIPLLAKRIDEIFGNNQGVINAALIGEGSRNSLINPDAWRDLGSEEEIFQYFKQLWHTAAYFG